MVGGGALRELTVRGLLLGAIVTVVFTASNVYLGLKIGLTFSSSIPAAVISMAVLGLARGSNILENNVVQTEASTGGTLSAVIFILPGLIMIGHWHGFPFWQTACVCALGGVLGVLYSAPLRRPLVVGAAAPPAHDAAEPGVADLLGGSIVGAGFAILATGLKVFAEELSWWFAAGGAVFRVGTGFSMALLGAGYLVGLVGGLAMLLGVVMAWGVAVPVLTAMTPMPPASTIAKFATGIWTNQVRFMGAGVIGIGAVWTLVTLMRPVIKGMRTSLAAMRGIGGGSGVAVPRAERNIPILVVMASSALLILPMIVVFYFFLAASVPALPAGLFWGLVVGAVLFAFVFGFLIAAAAGYMAGLVGSSSSPISGIGIVAVSLMSLLLLAVLGSSGLLSTHDGSRLGIAIALFTTAAIVATATTSNNNLQDLKTGLLVGGTPWRQQVALMVGCVVCALVMPPILDMLYTAYGFPGAMPREGMQRFSIRMSRTRS